MSREMLRGTTEAALTVAETYQDYLFVRARNLTGENSQTPASLGDIAIKLLIFGALAPSPHLMDMSTPLPTTNDGLEMFSDGVARRAELALEVADYYGSPQKSENS